MIFRILCVVAFAVTLAGCGKKVVYNPLKDKNQTAEKQSAPNKQSLCFLNIDPTIKTGFSPDTHQKIQQRCSLIDKQVSKLKDTAEKEIQALFKNAKEGTKEVDQKVSAIMARTGTAVSNVISQSNLSQYLKPENIKQLIEKYTSIIKKTNSDYSKYHCR